MATWPSPCTTPTASRSSSPRSGPTTRGWRSTAPASTPPWPSNAGTPVGGQGVAAGDEAVYRGLLEARGPTPFVGLTRELPDARPGGRRPRRNRAGAGTAEIFLDRTPFYAERAAGGDTGTIVTETGLALVYDTVPAVRAGRPTGPRRSGDPRRAGRAGDHRRGAARGHPAQPPRHAPGARARCATCWATASASRIAGRPGPPALRLLPHGPATRRGRRGAHPRQ